MGTLPHNDRNNREAEVDMEKHRTGTTAAPVDCIVSQQVRACQAVPNYGGHTISYIAGQEYLKKRSGTGPSQRFCRTCERWKFPDHRQIEGYTSDNSEACEIADLVPVKRCIQCGERRKAKDDVFCRRCADIADAD